jgi:hypothetical protein
MMMIDDERWPDARIGPAASPYLPADSSCPARVVRSRDDDASQWLEPCGVDPITPACYARQRRRCRDWRDQIRACTRTVRTGHGHPAEMPSLSGQNMLHACPMQDQWHIRFRYRRTAAAGLGPTGLISPCLVSRSHEWLMGHSRACYLIWSTVFDIRPRKKGFRYGELPPARDDLAGQATPRR